MSRASEHAVASAALGETLSATEVLSLLEHRDPVALLAAARARRDRIHGERISFSPKVFVPLTQLCRDVCRYCTFAQAPAAMRPAYLPIEQVLAIAHAGAKAGCREALFTLGDRPEARYRAAREALRALGHVSTLDYLAEAARRVRDETGLLPHLNPGLMSGDAIERLRTVSVSCGLMLESSSPRLCERGGPHHGCPDKRPEARLASIAAAGERSVPFTSGILVGIGETRRERVESLLALRELHERHGHLQEVIVQNFRAKPGTAMANAPEPALDDHLWTIAVARLVLPGEVSVQAPPNLSPGALERLLLAGIDDWGGVSPVTPDHVNPEAPWPRLAELRRATEAAGKVLVPRLAIYPRYVADAERWVAPEMRPALLAQADADGYAREDDWLAGRPSALPAPSRARALRRAPPALRDALRRAGDGAELNQAQLLTLFAARGPDVTTVCEHADRLRRDTVGERVSYVVNRNINYTNVCTYGCRFCAFSKGRRNRDLRGEPYELAMDEIARRVEEAWARGATEICLQGGIHPHYSGETYLAILRAVKRAAPDVHVHAFSPLEVWHGAQSLGISVAEFLTELRRQGLGSLPGTAAEVLDDAVRAVICPDKIDSAQWLAVMRTAHGLGIRSTATVMFGHVDGPRHWVRHLMRVRELAVATGGFTEFVPLPFVHLHAPLFRQGRARRGPTFREALLMHAVARLALNAPIANVQTSWVKMGPEGALACLAAGANDVGGTLMNESITRAAGAAFGQELSPAELETLIRSAGRTPSQRTTLYRAAPRSRVRASFQAAALLPPVETPLRRARAVADTAAGVAASVDPRGIG